MWMIIKNEWKYLARTKALIGISIAFLVILIATIYLGYLQTSTQEEYYQRGKAELRAQWENIDAMNPHSAAHYGTYVFKPTSILSSLDDGVYSATGNVLRVEGHVQNEMVYSEASQMQSISKFGKLKTSLLLQVILPLFLLFLAFQSVHSERQTNRLRLLVLQGSKPTHIIWAKTLSVWLFGLTLLVLSICIYTLINIQKTNAEVVARLAFFFSSYALYYFIIVGLTVFFTTKWKQSGLALTAMLGVWMLWTVFIPNIMMSTVEKWHELPSRNAFQAAMREDRSQGIDGHNPADERAKALEERVLKEYGVDSLQQLPINFDGIVMQEDEEYGNKVWDKHFGALRSVLANQKQSYSMAGLMNPFISLQNASMGFSGSDNYHHQAFLLQVENYRRGFIKTLNDEHAFGGSKTGDWSWMANNAFFKSVPDYEYQPIPLTEMFDHYILDLMLLLGWSMVVSLLISYASKKVQLL